MTILHEARSIHDFNAGGPEHRTRIADTERRQRREFGRHLRRDRTERQRSVDPETRPQVVRLQAPIGMVVDPRSKFPNSRSLDGETRRLSMAAKFRHQVGARFERRQHVE